MDGSMPSNEWLLQSNLLNMVQGSLKYPCIGTTPKIVFWDACAVCAVIRRNLTLQ
jgi:hypothetical protein